MSLEQEIKELREAVTNLTEAFIAHTNDAAPAKKAGAAKPKVTAKNVAEHLEEGGEAAPAETAPKKVATTIVDERKAKEAAKAPAKAAASGDAIDPAYAPVKAAILAAIAGGHRAEIAKMFAKYGVKNGQELTPDTYDEVLGKVDEIVNGNMA